MDILTNLKSTVNPSLNLGKRFGKAGQNLGGILSDPVQQVNISKGLLSNLPSTISGNVQSAKSGLANPGQFLQGALANSIPAQLMLDPKDFELVNYQKQWAREFQKLNRRKPTAEEWQMEYTERFVKPNAMAEETRNINQMIISSEEKMGDKF